MLSMLASTLHVINANLLTAYLTGFRYDSTKKRVILISSSLLSILATVLVSKMLQPELNFVILFLGVYLPLFVLIKKLERGIVIFFNAIIGLLFISIFGHTIMFIINVLLFLLNHVADESFSIISYLLAEIIVFGSVCLINRTDLSRKYKYLTSDFRIMLTIILLGLISMVLFAFYFYSSVDYFDPNFIRQQIPYYIAMGLFTLFIIIFFIFIIGQNEKRKKIELREKEYNSLVEYSRKLEDIQEEFHSFRHDYLNILLSLETSIMEKDMDGIEQTFYKIIKPTREVTKKIGSEITKLNRVEVTGIKSILFSKLMQCELRKIRIHVEIPKNINHINMDYLDFVRIITIFLDNAIESAEISSKPYVSLSIFEHEGSQNVIIENSCDQTIKDLTKLSEKKYSTKDSTGHRGYGLNNAKKIIHLYPGVALNTEFKSSRFTQHLQIKNEFK